MLRTTDAILTVYFGNDGVEIKRVHLEGLQFPAGGSKLAGLKPAKARRQPDLKCLPQGPASASEAPRPAPSTPTQQLSDAGSDGMFN